MVRSNFVGCSLSIQAFEICCRQENGNYETGERKSLFSPPLLTLDFMLQLVWCRFYMQYLVFRIMDFTLTRWVHRFVSFGHTFSHANFQWMKVSFFGQIFDMKTYSGLYASWILQINASFVYFALFIRFTLFQVGFCS